MQKQGWGYNELLADTELRRWYDNVKKPICKVKVDVKVNGNPVLGMKKVG